MWVLVCRAEAVVAAEGHQRYVVLRRAWLALHAGAQEGAEQAQVGAGGSHTPCLHTCLCAPCGTYLTKSFS